MGSDATQLSRTAKLMAVECRKGVGSPPVFGPWRPVWSAKIDRIEINAGARPSLATIWFPDLRWDASTGLCYGDMVRIRWGNTVLFVGFITSRLSDFSGGDETQGSSFERNAIVCCDHRWLLAATCPIFGQFARGPDDYVDYETEGTQYPKDSYIFLSGRRTIFNADGRPNRDPALLNFAGAEWPLFADPDIAVSWTAREMVSYILSPFYNQAYDYFPIPDPGQLPGLDHSDWDKVLNHIVVEGLSIIEALQHICKNLGYSFRADFLADGTVTLCFYRLGAAAGFFRSDANPTILHTLHAPGVGESVSAGISGGRKMLWSMSLAQNMASVVNSPWGLAAPHQFEFTAELVPAWKDIDLEPDDRAYWDYLFFTDADLQNYTKPNDFTFYKHYHPRGESFRRDVGRRWALNESGRYSAADSYDRGAPFDFTTVLPAEYILDRNQKRLYAPFNRRLLTCLTADKNTLNTVGIKVEFSFDGGATWQVIPASISSLKDECGIYIDEANLAEMVDQEESGFSEGEFEGMPVNLWSSLCDDKVNERSFKNGQWHTRVRITASVQMDQRLYRQAQPMPASGSPFHHSQVYDFSEQYGLKKRTASSVFSSSDLPAWNVNDSDWFDRHLDAVRDANSDISVSGRFTLERLWLGEGGGFPDFAVGDCIQRITGREYDLSAALAAHTVYPEIVRIIYLPDRQRMQLITRDLRFADTALI